MKKILIPITGLSLMVILSVGCNKNISNRTDNTAALSTDNNDLGAGSWKPVFLSRADSFPVAAPDAINSTSYKADLNEIKALQQNLTKDEESKIKYWAAGGVLRWNEIMRDLMAKYNLPTVTNAAGNYPAPDANNPFAYPLFPFTNPPYAGRAYAYVSGAQYDALIACWYYKTKYNQAAPYKNDSSVDAKFINKTDLPSYPSEAAVLAGAAAEMMKLLFPGEIANIQQKATEQEQAAIASGAATRAAVVAGDALGRKVAQLYITRARGDHAGTAGGNPTIWTNFETIAMGLGETPWVSLRFPDGLPCCRCSAKCCPVFLIQQPFLLSDQALLPAPTARSSKKTLMRYIIS
jgi:hypothetical protein